jgi:hypothetical protein
MELYKVPFRAGLLEGINTNQRRFGYELKDTNLFL